MYLNCMVEIPDYQKGISKKNQGDDLYLLRIWQEI